MPSSTLADLPDHASLRIVPCHPPLESAVAEALVKALGKLLAQFEREERLSSYAVSAAANGGVIVIATVEQGEGWSGCRKDMLARVLVDHEQRSGSQLLTPPPIVVDENDTAVCMTMGAFRSQVAVGAITSETLVWDHLCPDLGTWREQMPTPAAQVPWLAQAMARMVPTR